jgi:SAM-dependent methyltransferase
VTCVACGAGSLRPHFSVKGDAGAHGLIPTTDRFGVALGDFVRCDACGHLQLETMPTLDLAGTASDDYELEEEGQRITARAALDQIERHAHGRLLDYGCWVGFLGSEAIARGWDVVGVEPSRWAAERARSRGIEVVEEPGGTFDAVLLGDVIEHLPEPAAVLEFVRPGGVVWIATPDAGSRVARLLGKRWWSVIPTHVHLFTRPSLKALLDRNGFEVLAMGTAPKTFSVAYYLERLGGYSPWLARALVRGAQLAGVADCQWAPDFRDRFYVVARRRRQG